jgi:UDP-2,3-diacylglucosamine hydrolase
LEKEHVDFFVFGHRHLTIDMMVGENSRYINLGDWLQFYTYAVYDGTQLEFKKYLDK